MKVKIDREACTLCAVCWETCPDVFEENPDDGTSQIVEKYRIDGQLDQGEIPDELSECATQAANGCPVEIIHIKETGTLD